VLTAEDGEKGCKMAAAERPDITTPLRRNARSALQQKMRVNIADGSKADATSCQ